MNYRNLQAAIQLVMAQAQPYAIKATPAELQVVTQNKPWLQSDRHAVRNGLESVLYAALDVLGLQRFQLPTEYVAAVICSAVHPVNWMIACIYLSDQNITNLDVKAGYGQTRDLMNPEKLFSVVLLASAQAESINSKLVDDFKKAMELEVEEDV